MAGRNNGYGTHGGAPSAVIKGGSVKGRNTRQIPSLEDALWGYASAAMKRYGRCDVELSRDLHLAPFLAGRMNDVVGDTAQQERKGNELKVTIAEALQRGFDDETFDRMLSLSFERKYLSETDIEYLKQINQRQRENAQSAGMSV